MLTHIFRTWSELSPQEKANIINWMFAAQNPWERDSTRKSLAEQYWIKEWTITSLIAHETMRRQREQWWEPIVTPEIVQSYTQDTVYTITSISGLNDTMRNKIFTEFRDIVSEHAWKTWYDYYEDIGAISEYHDVDPTILEEYLRIRFKWLGVLLDSLKKNENTDKLTHEDKMTIRDYVEAWTDKENKKKRRKEMVKKYGVSIYVIWAITAWKKWENGNITLWEKTDWISAIPTIRDEVSIQSEWISETIDGIPEFTWISKWEVLLSEEFSTEIQDPDNWETIDSSLLEEDSPDEVLDIEFILDLATAFELKNDTERWEFLDDVFECFPDATLDDIKRIIPDFPDDTTHTNEKRSGEWMWALIEYNNEIKNKWRQKLKEFINENTDAAKRKDMKVLCLPGLKCLEIPLYLELGFQPENIVWVEAGIVKWKKDPELIRQFEENATRYWIQTRIGKLEKLLETEETVFDVVSLDFLGPINKVVFSAISRMKNNKNLVFIINHLGKREDKKFSIRLKREEYYWRGQIRDSFNGPYDIWDWISSKISLTEARDAWRAYISYLNNSVWVTQNFVHMSHLYFQ